jgi:hypothetical protein
MSSSREVYLGYYLVVDAFVETKRTVRQCSNDPRHRLSSHSAGFCHMCGAEIVQVPKTDIKRMTCYDAAEKFGFEEEDGFYNVHRDEQPHIWLSNTTADNCVDTNYEVSAIEITHDAMHLSLVNFNRRFHKEMAILDQHEVDYILAFGLVTHYM